MNRYYEYKSKQFKCDKCGWTGNGGQAKQGEVFEAVFEIDCPNCYEKIGSVAYPTHEETLKYGTDEEKRSVKKRIEFENRMIKSKLNSIKQLPKIDGNKLIFKTITETVNDDLYLKILYNNEVIWEEIIGYEYYSRFIGLGKLFKQKYGSRLHDFIEEKSVYLYGDSISAFKIIDEFRNSLKS